LSEPNSTGSRRVGGSAASRLSLVLGGPKMPRSLARELQLQTMRRMPRG